MSETIFIINIYCWWWADTWFLPLRIPPPSKFPVTVVTVQWQMFLWTVMLKSAYLQGFDSLNDENDRTFHSILTIAHNLFLVFSTFPNFIFFAKKFERLSLLSLMTENHWFKGICVVPVGCENCHSTVTTVTFMRGNLYIHSRKPSCTVPLFQGWWWGFCNRCLYWYEQSSP